MKRLVQPEILDSLPQDHPDAVANRRDLQLINRIMGNPAWFEKTLLPWLHPDDRIIELGAGAGELGAFLRRKAAIPHYCGLDLWSRPPDWPNEWDWAQEDLLTFDRYTDFTLVIANLILHQFDDESLRRLGEKWAGSGIRLVLASEPARRVIHQWQLKLLYPLGLHPVSRHDGHVSVAAGFRGRELPELLGLSEPPWRGKCATRFFGAYRICFGRDAPPKMQHACQT